VKNFLGRPQNMTAFQKWMAEEFEVSQKTVKRDVEWMKVHWDLPIDYDRQRHGYFYSKPVTRFPGVPTVTEAEMFALLVAHKAVEQYSGTPFHKPLQMAFQKLTGQLDGKALYYVADAASGLPVAKANVEFFGWKSEQIKPNTNQFRVVTWRTGIQMIRRHPILGLGPENVKLRFDDYVPSDVPRPLPSGWYGHLHNIYLHYAAERGIPAMLILVWMLIQIIVDFWRGLRALPAGYGSRRFLLHGGIAVVLATMAEGFVELNLGDSEVLTMFLVVVACGYLALEKDLAAA
jgi:hypothetical protein